MRNKKRMLAAGLISVAFLSTVTGCGSASRKVTEGCLVLEGGAFRGLYSQGFMDAMMKAGINMQCTIGVSAGAMAGMNYVAGQRRGSLRYFPLLRQFSA